MQKNAPVWGDDKWNAVVHEAINTLAPGLINPDQSPYFREPDEVLEVFPGGPFPFVYFIIFGDYPPKTLLQHRLWTTQTTLNKFKEWFDQSNSALKHPVKSARNRYFTAINAGTYTPTGFVSNEALDINLPTRVDYIIMLWERGHSELEGLLQKLLPLALREIQCFPGYRDHLPYLNKWLKAIGATKDAVCSSI